MKLWRSLRVAWASEMNAADRVRVLFAFGFPLGALLHFGWVARHSLFYHGPAPAWAVWFWYGLCAVDFVECWIMLTRPRLGIALGVTTMAVSLLVNWVCFPTFQFGVNLVLLGLTMFGLTLFACAPWMWRLSRWIPTTRENISKLS